MINQITCSWKGIWWWMKYPMVCSCWVLFTMRPCCKSYLFLPTNPPTPRTWPNDQCGGLFLRGGLFRSLWLITFIFDNISRYSFFSLLRICWNTLNGAQIATITVCCVVQQTTHYTISEFCIKTHKINVHKIICYFFV